MYKMNKVNDRQNKSCNTSELTLWAQRFAAIIKRVSTDRDLQRAFQDLTHW